MNGEERAGGVRWAWSAVLLGVAVAVWFVLPMIAATALALDHPAWARSGHASDPGTDAMSWWPPGRRYEWSVGESPGPTAVAVDPWGSVAEGHWWTAIVVGGLVASLLWLNRSQLPRRGRCRQQRLIRGPIDTALLALCAHDLTIG